MSQVFSNADVLDDAEFARSLARNHGMWKNVLALGPKDAKIVEMVQLVWNVTAEAKRIRSSTMGMGRGR